MVEDGDMRFSNSSSENSGHTHKALGFWHAPIRYVFGYDIFISYARADAHAYADSLQTKLEALGFATFLDKHEIDAGDKLDETLSRAIRRSRQFILLDTPTARKSPWVAGEIETFLRSKRPRLTRIIRKLEQQELSLGDWSNTEIGKRLEGYVWAEDTAKAFASGRPGDQVIEQIHNNFRTVRFRNLMRFSIAMVIAGLSALLIWSLIQTMAARKAARIATAREVCLAHYSLNKSIPN
jgi:TIR domain